MFPDKITVDVSIYIYFQLNIFFLASFTGIIVT